MSKAEVSGDMGDDLMRACNDAQQINLNGHAYLITFVDERNELALINLERFPRGDRVLSNDRYLTFDQSKDDKLIDLVKQIRADCDGDGICVFDQKKYIQAITNLAEGMPASVVAEALEKAAEYIRNQKVQAYREEK